MRPSPCPTSACVASSASSCRADGPSWTGASRSWCSGTRCVFSNGSFTHVSAIDQQIERSSRRSAGCCLDHVGGPSWLPPTRCCDGTGKRSSTNGAVGGGNETLAVIHRRLQCQAPLRRSGGQDPRHTGSRCFRGGGSSSGPGRGSWATAGRRSTMDATRSSLKGPYGPPTAGCSYAD